MNLQKIIFDLDGTLVNTIGGIGYSANSVLISYGYPVHDIANYKQFVGYGLKRTLYNALPLEARSTIAYNSSLMEEMYQELLISYDIHFLKDTHLYEGINELLDYLNTIALPWGIHTNKKESIALLIAEHYFRGRKYLGLVGQSETYPLKPDPTGTFSLLMNTNPAQALFIGDTEVDAQTGDAAGMQVLIVPWGFRDKDFLSELGKPMVDTPLDIIEYIRKLV